MKGIMNLHQLFDTQVQTLIHKDYPHAFGLDATGFTQLVAPLKSMLDQYSDLNLNIEDGQLPFVLVVKSNVVPAESAMSRVERNGQSGVTKLYPHNSTDFQPISDVIIPDSKIYLLIDIDRGQASLNITPSMALKQINKLGRTPLTIEEGIALITHYPEFLIKNNCYSLLASRHTGDQRVPAIWINGSKAPNLGWCWDGNPHTWLGSASARLRIGLP